MVVITIGNAATNRASEQSSEDLTCIDRVIPATNTGFLNSVYFWFSTDAANVIVGTFYGAGSSQTPRDWVNVGNIAAGSAVTISNLRIQVVKGDLIGWYCLTGKMKRDAVGQMWYKSGNQFGAGTQTYTSAGRTNSIGGSGLTLPDVPRIARIMVMSP